MNEAFRRCSTCKAPIAYGAEYYTCSVSTCNHKRTGLFFCSVPCWDAHVPGARHRDAWAEKQVAPRSAASDLAAPDEGARRRIVSAAPAPGAASSVTTSARSDSVEGDDGADILVVVSKLKAYIRERSGMNTSGGVAEVLSDHLRTIAQGAIREAGKEGRKTVLERDVAAALGRRS